MISAFSVSCGTRLAPRNSKASITCPLGFTAGAASALGVSNCGRWPGWAAGAAAGAAGGVAGGVGAGAVGIVSKGLGLGGVAGGGCRRGRAGGWPAGGRSGGRGRGGNRLEGTGLRGGRGRRLLPRLRGRLAGGRLLGGRLGEHRRADGDDAETDRDHDQAETPEKLHASIPFHSARLR